MHPFDGGCSDLSEWKDYMRHWFKTHFLVPQPWSPSLEGLWLGPGIFFVTAVQKILSALDIIEEDMQYPLKSFLGFFAHKYKLEVSYSR